MVRRFFRADSTMLAIPFPALDPVAISFGPFAIRWYGLAYFAGILIGWWYAGRLVSNDRLWGRRAPITRADIDDLVLWIVVGVVAGGRIGYAIFYEPGHFLNDPAAFFKLWQGGMSFHGGLTGTILAMAIFSLRRKIPMLSLFDVSAAAVPFGLFFGRIANFINGELWGRPTTVPWGMVFPGAGPLPRHPSELYEAGLEGIVLFIVLRLLTHRFKSLTRPGVTGGAFVAGYGIARITVEFFREPDAQIGFLAGGLTMGMVLSIPMVIIGIVAVIVCARRSERQDEGEAAGLTERE
jgi:phosphatidylglycerol---prolipoprotein diacylglyceryl transferase